jgi:hypothetical protein
MHVLEDLNKLQANEFEPGDLVIWYDHHGNKHLPIPAVVVRQQLESILIKARVEGAIKEVDVSPEELVSR